MSASTLPKSILPVADGFWNLRGSFRVGPLAVGTHASLVRRADGTFVLLDAFGFDDAVRSWLMRTTDDGARLAAVLHLHPFHTAHVESAQALFPRAALYGTERHAHMFPALPWQPLRTNDVALHRQFAEDFDFLVPRGVRFIAPPKLHFASVLALHKPTRTLHVDDTLVFARLPWPLRLFARDLLRFHPTLRWVLEDRAGAADDFRAWSAELVERARGLDNLCAAHSAALLARDNRGAPIAERIARAQQHVERLLRAHERKHRR